MLQLRYHQLDSAKQAIGTYAEQLDTVSVLGRELTTFTEMETLARAVLDTLHARLGAGGAAVWIRSDVDGPARLIASLNSQLASPPLVAQLGSGARALGHIEVWGLPEEKAVHLEMLRPWLTIALENARSFELLREEQANLERRVEERTRELSLAKDQVEVALARQRELDRLKTEFFDNVSHELRTPLTLILLSLEGPQQRADLPQAVRQQLELASRSAERLLRMINQLLDLAKLDAGKTSLHYQPTELHGFLASLLLPFQSLAQKQGTKLTLEGAAASPIQADAEMLDIIFQNLLSNALKFTTGGAVLVRLREEESYLAVEVADTGVGIAEENLSYVFQRFAQAGSAQSRRFSGSGIGLSLVKEMVELHGGQVSVQSEPGRGSTFRVELPKGTAHVREDLRARPDPESPPLQPWDREPQLAFATPAPAPTEEDLADLGPTGALEGADFSTVLVVEDDLEMRRVLCALLSPRYRVLQAADGKEGLRRAREELPDLILSDLMLPQISGTRLIEAVRAEVRTADIPVILLTARSEVNSAVEGLHAGANDFVGKPFSPRELMARIDTQLHLRAAVASALQNERLATLGLLTTGFAHEVRNPINGLIHSIAPIRDCLRTGADPMIASELLEVMSECSKRICHLSENLLGLAQSRDELCLVDLRQSLETSLKVLSWRLPRGVLIEREYLCEEPVRGQLGPLSQVWLNLLDNALRAVGEEGRICLRTERAADQVLVRIADSGPGISPAVKRRLFQPFFTTRPAGEGTGLGLALCRRILHSQEGQIEVKSEAGQGAEFIVRLPLASTAASSSIARSSRGSTSSSV